MIKTTKKMCHTVKDDPPMTILCALSKLSWAYVHIVTLYKSFFTKDTA